MAMQDFAKLSAYVDTAYQVFLTSISINGENGEQLVRTFEGLAGFSPGTGVMTVEFGYVIPIGGEDYPFWNKMVNREYVQLQLPVGAKTIVGLGKILTTGISQDVDGAIAGTASWTGELGEMQ
jgi:hypothetical protein